MALLWKFDELISKVLVNRKALRQELKFHNFRERARGELKPDIVQSVLYDMSSINDKVSSLLQHISVIVAGLAVLYATTKSRNLEITIAIILVFYIFNSIILLRCLNIMGQPHMFDFTASLKYRNAILKEVLIRRKLFVLALRITIMTSIFSAVAFIFLVRSI